ncbi:hypothetical protein DAEQUDRAFT_769398 [Daedalea quercina L-15889]|uniref:Uncharacterized protein n=1 Tax=Daedalea quercina L-15889 TaxID=1314783 RepID=A0A165LRA8_9APHY|nr:hypothetical protein DAEQUDRAFT_769398 [Daedalea quercina L-15889]
MKGTRDNYDEHRWSELFPPHTALTFAAVWDPVEGMITFSGAHLLDSEGGEHVAARPLPKDALDNQSQAPTLDMLLQYYQSTPTQKAFTATERDREPVGSWACDARTETCTDGVNSQFLPQWLGIPRGLSTGLNSPAFASSAALTFMIPPESNAADMQQRYSNMLRAAGGWTGGHSGMPFRPMSAHKESSSQCDDCVSDEGFFEGRQLPSGSYASVPVLVDMNLSSRFSVTTTSTNTYIEVDFPSEYGYDEDKYSQLDYEASSWETVRGMDRHFCLNVPPPDRRRRLRKRTLPTPSSPTVESKPASPQSVLSRKRFNHGRSDSAPLTPTSPTLRTWPPRPPTPPPSPSLPTTLKRKASHARAKMMNRLQKVGKNPEDGWVCVDVEQRVVHRVEHNIV